jgi:cyclohexyl-isocyanide hydratase
MVAELCGVEAAQRIQLDIAYAPEPPFDSGTPATAPPAVLARARADGAALRMRREATAKRLAARFRIATRLAQDSADHIH